MDFQRWLVVGLCFCIFTGCKSAQSYHDYCGPMPAEGGDFMYRKNSVLGGDPAMKRLDQEPPADQRDETIETGPEPTPAPSPDEEPAPGMNMEGGRPETEDEAAAETDDEELDELADEGSDPEMGEEVGEAENDSDEEVAGGDNRQPSASTVEWRVRSKNDRAPLRQVRFQAE